MKPVSLCGVMLCILAACNTPKTKSENTASIADSSFAAPAAPLTYAYMPGYSADSK